MTPLQSRIFYAFILFLVSHGADSVKVIVGDPFKVPLTCDPSESVTLLRVGLGGTRVVGTVKSGELEVSREEDRGRIKKDSSNLVFTHTQYSDGGTYELTCSTSGNKEIIQLEVVFACNVLVTQGEPAILPCYYKNIEGTSLRGRWEKDGKSQCVKNSMSECSSGTPADRLTVSTDWITSGDLSLNIDGVQPEDGGDYYCYTQDEKQSKPGTPAAVRLTVTEKKSHQMSSSTAAPTDQTQSCAEHTQPWKTSTLVLTVILLFALVALVALLCLWLCGKISCNFDRLVCTSSLYKLYKLHREDKAGTSEAKTPV